MPTNPRDIARTQEGESTGDGDLAPTIAFTSTDGVTSSNGLDRIHHYEGLAPEPEHAFDRIAELAAHLFDTPAAMISLIDDESLWFKSAIGVDGDRCSLSRSFCIHAIENKAPLVVLDTHNDKRFDPDNLVDSEPEIQFYAGAPLIADDGTAIGALCVLDTEPRSEPISQDKIQHLVYLAEIVVDELDLRHVIQKGVEREQELRDARNNAESANEAMSHFFAGITHDLRTPLTRILLFNDLLERTLEQEDQPSTDQSYTERIRAAGTRMNMLITSLLELAELRSGRFELDLETINVSEVVTAACEGVELMSESDTDRLDVYVPNRPLYARADSSALTRVLDNLIGNAIKHTDPSDRVVVTLRLPDSSTAHAGTDEMKDATTELGLPTLRTLPAHVPSTIDPEAAGRSNETVLIEVADNGPGISPDLLATLFDPYTQGPKRASSDNDMSSSGVGLGLAITSDLVRAMDGEIHVHTEEGVGTCFHIHLPAVAMD
jgi:signal transduction histidine kinase